MCEKPQSQPENSGDQTDECWRKFSSLTENQGFWKCFRLYLWECSFLKIIYKSLSSYLGLTFNMWIQSCSLKALYKCGCIKAWGMNPNNFQWVPHSTVSHAFSKRFYKICKTLIPCIEINIDGQVVNASLFLLLWNELAQRTDFFPAGFLKWKPKFFPLQWEQLNWKKLLEKFRVKTLYFLSVRAEIELNCLLSQKYTSQRLMFWVENFQSELLKYFITRLLNKY